MRTLVLYTPRSATLRKLASELRGELHWRGFDAEIEPADSSTGRDVGDYRLVVLVFPAVHLGPWAMPLGDVENLVSRLGGLQGADVALLAVSPTNPRRRLGTLVDLIRHQGGNVAAQGNATPSPLGRQGLVDLAAECMARIPA